MKIKSKEEESAFFSYSNSSHSGNAIDGLREVSVDGRLRHAIETLQLATDVEVALTD